MAEGRSWFILFDGVVSKIKGRLHQWSFWFLLAGGKLILLRHVLNSIPMYVIQVIQLPRGVLIQLGRLFNSFLWDNNVEGKRIHWTSWEKVYFPVEEDGLGTRSLIDVVHVISFELWWKGVLP